MMFLSTATLMLVWEGATLEYTFVICTDVLLSSSSSSSFAVSAASSHGPIPVPVVATTLLRGGVEETDGISVQRGFLPSVGQIDPPKMNSFTWLPIVPDPCSVSS